MLFATIGKAKSSTTKERVGRRMEWQYPEGLKMVAEYWVMSPDPVLIAIVEADDIGPIMAAIAQWDDLIDMQVYPAITADKGLELAKQMMQG